MLAPTASAASQAELLHCRGPLGIIHELLRLYQAVLIGDPLQPGQLLGLKLDMAAAKNLHECFDTDWFSTGCSAPPYNLMRKCER